MAITLFSLEDLASASAGDLLGSAGRRVIIDDDHFIGQTGIEILQYRRTNRVLLVVGRQNDSNPFTTPHSRIIGRLLLGLEPIGSKAFRPRPETAPLRAG